MRTLIVFFLLLLAIWLIIGLRALSVYGQEHIRPGEDGHLSRIYAIAGYKHCDHAEQVARALGLRITRKDQANGDCVLDVTGDWRAVRNMDDAMDDMKGDARWGE